MEEGVKNFTNQRFRNPSICEYQTFEEDSSPKKKRSEPKPIIGFKMYISVLQKAQYQDKWPRNYEIMIQSPELAKPVLHLPQLEAITSKTLNIGDQEINLYIQKVHPVIQKSQTSPHKSYNVLESLPACLGAPRCTRLHWIRRIPIRPEERPSLLTLAKPILFKECILLLQFGSTQTYLWKPEHHLNHPEDIQEILSFTST
ncbi:hypothetical protein IGI04_001913 [Brassica rapa subsp. trilocularis]|uniref:Uncharacterized protein n=1 Tax=Brassica rapa subsp. trilocularis TaxID=1813537 RepID=A0ABQ7NU14_BRACM|nr:hypothetical protein IGI04_001913 [Brassica rapa subsp. trilocularis]